jgi:hypothetical protein
MRKTMNRQNALRKTITGILILLIGAVSLCAQEAPPPPPPQGLPGGDNYSFKGDVFFFNRMEGASTPRNIKGAPYSAQAITESNQTLSDGNQIHHKTAATLYRDSEGRTRVEQTLGGFGPWAVPENKTRQIIRISDPVAGANYVLNPDDHTAEKMPEKRGQRMMFQDRNSGPGELPAPGRPERGERRFLMRVPPPAGDGEGGEIHEGGGPGFEWRSAEKDDNVQTESLGSQVIEGVQADGTRRTVTIPAGRIGNDKPIQIVTERWYSSQLQAVVLSKRTDPRVGETIYRLTNISQAEPQATLFQIPAGYSMQEGPRMRRQFRDQKPKANQQ